MKILTVTEAARNFSDLVSRVHYGGESALLVKGGRPMVKVTPARRARTGADLAMRWPELPHLAAAEAEAFGRDIEAARANLPVPDSKWD